MSAYKKEKLQYANKHIAVRKNYNFPYVGIIQIRLRVLSNPAFSQPAFCKHPFFVSVDIINTLILGIKCYLNFLFALEEAPREVPVSLQPESLRHPEYNQMHRPDTY